MAIQSAAFIRRFMPAVCLVLLLTCWLCVAAGAQAPSVISGSVVPLTHNTWGQTFDIVISSRGDVLFLDTENGAVYRLLRDGKTFTTLSAPGAALTGPGKFYNHGMTIDSHDTLYITSRYNDIKIGIDMYRIPYDSVHDTWPVDTQHGWPLYTSLGTYDVAADANDDLIVSTEATFAIYRLRVNKTTGAQDTAPEPIITGLKYHASYVAVDKAGNVYFNEDPFDTRSLIVPGVFMIPAGKTIAGTGNGDAEAQCTRIDPGLNDWNGMTVDAAGNVYISDENDKFNNGQIKTGPYPGGAVIMVPNVNGSLDLDPTHAVLVAPIPARAAVAIDPRGFLWIPRFNDPWAPLGSLPVAGTNNFVKYALGSADLGAARLGTAGGAGTAWFTFSSDTTLGSSGWMLTQLGSGADFAVLTTDPNPDPASTVASTPCTPGVTYKKYDRCPIWGQLQPRTVGGLSGELSLVDAQNNAIPGSAIELHGVGQGAAMAILRASTQSIVASGLTTPSQIAADSVGNIYIADSGAGKVLKYPGGTSVGTGLTAPTGVAADGAGNVYIGDAGKVIKVPVQGAQTVLKSGLGSPLNLAVDGAGNVYAADPQNGRVVKVLNAPTAAILPGYTATAGAGFTHPTAVAVDQQGNLFVVDGQNLIEVTTGGAQTTITSQLGSVTGLAVDPSGSVYVAQSTGLLRIPTNPEGSLDFTAATALAENTIPSALGIALDGIGNVYVAESSSVSQLSVAGTVNFNDFGPVIPYAEADAEALIFNVGNLPLTLSDWTTDFFSGTDAAEFQLVAPTDSPACDPATPAAPGSSCWVGVGVTPAAEGARNAILTINAANRTAPVTLNLAATAVVDTRPATSVTIATSPAQLTFPADVTVTVTVARGSGSDVPVGTVTLSVSGLKAVSADLQNGVATFNFPKLNGGAYNVKATYAGNGTAFGVSAGTGQFTVVPASATVATSAPPAYYIKVQDSVELTATVTSTVGSPTGKVIFTEGSQPADPAQPFAALDANGNATFNTSGLAVGLHTITAVYQGGTNFATSSAASVTFRIVNPTVKITANPATISVKAGTPGTATLTLSSIAGYSSSVRLACTNLPQYSECTFNEPQPEIKSNGSAQVVVTISTNVPVNVAAKSHPSPWLFASMFGFGLVGLVAGKKTRYQGRVLMMICALLLIGGATLGMAACGNTGYSQPPPTPHVTTAAGTYNVTITATQTSNLQDVTLYEPEKTKYTLQLTVQ